MYSTSANEHNKIFDENFAVSKSDIIVYTKNEFLDLKSSNIYKLTNEKIKKIR